MLKQYVKLRNPSVNTTTRQSAHCNGLLSRLNQSIEAVDQPDHYEEYLNEIAHLPDNERMDRLLQFLANDIARWDGGMLKMLRDQYAAKGDDQATAIAEVIEGHLALRAIRRE